MGHDQSETNKAIVREAFDTLFNKHDYAAAKRFWSKDCIQHSAQIPPGREALFDVVKSRPPEYSYELELIMAENDMVMLRGRFSGRGPGYASMDSPGRSAHGRWVAHGALGRTGRGGLTRQFDQWASDVR